MFLRLECVEKSPFFGYTSCCHLSFRNAPLGLEQYFVAAIEYNIDAYRLITTQILILHT